MKQLFLDVDIAKCNGTCFENVDIATGKIARFDQGVKFNVLIIGN